MGCQNINRFLILVDKLLSCIIIGTDALAAALADEDDDEGAGGEEEGDGDDSEEDDIDVERTMI